MATQDRSARLYEELESQLRRGDVGNSREIMRALEQYVEAKIAEALKGLRAD